MILVLNKDISPQQDARLTAYLEGLGLTATRQLCQGTVSYTHLTLPTILLV